MADKLNENAIEQLAIERLTKQGYQYIHGTELAPDAVNLERTSFSDVFLEVRLRDAVARINPDIPSEAREQAFKAVGHAALCPTYMEANETFHRMFTNGVEVEIHLHDSLLLLGQGGECLKNGLRL